MAYGVSNKEVARSTAEAPDVRATTGGIRMVGSEPVDATSSSEFMGYRIEVAHVPFDEQAHHSFVERLLAAGSPWGVQNDLWQWIVSDGGTVLASDQELSELAANEGARYWVRSNPLVP